MDRIEEILNVLDFTLNSKAKRHLVGGVLVIISLLFGGLAITIITLKTEDEEIE